MSDISSEPFPAFLAALASRIAGGLVKHREPIDEHDYESIATHAVGIAQAIFDRVYNPPKVSSCDS